MPLLERPRVLEPKPTPLRMQGLFLVAFVCMALLMLAHGPGADLNDRLWWEHRQATGLAATALTAFTAALALSPTVAIIAVSAWAVSRTARFRHLWRPLLEATTGLTLGHFAGLATAVVGYGSLEPWPVARWMGRTLALVAAFALVAALVGYPLLRFIRPVVEARPGTCPRCGYDRSASTRSDDEPPPPCSECGDRAPPVRAAPPQPGLLRRRLVLVGLAALLTFSGIVVRNLRWETKIDSVRDVMAAAGMPPVDVSAAGLYLGSTPAWAQPGTTSISGISTVPSPAVAYRCAPPPGEPNIRLNLAIPRWPTRDHWVEWQVHHSDSPYAAPAVAVRFTRDDWARIEAHGVPAGLLGRITERVESAFSRPPNAGPVELRPFPDSVERGG